jgi:ligand-binding sensor domain-containing protein/two-component sensor histidine kinase
LKLICTILFLAASIIAKAQPDKIVFDHYGLAEGFNSREAMDITTTPNGLVWITSNDGLVRFDGKRFKFYQHIPGDSNSLLMNYCTALEADKRGWLWIASGSSLELFNPQQEKFYHLKLAGDKNEKIKVNPTGFYYDKLADAMWITTRKGLYFSKGGSFELQPASSFTNDKLIMESDYYSIMPDDAHHLWLTSRYEVCKLNVKNGKSTWIKVAEKFSKEGFGKPFGNIMSSYLDSNKVLWLGTYMSGLIEYNTNTGFIKQYYYRDPNKEENIVGNITKVKGQPDLLWLSTSGFGFTAFNTTTHQFTSYATNVHNEKNGIKGNTYGLYNDKNNIMWIGSETGLHKYDANKQLFTTLDLTNIANGVTLLPVSCMAVQKSTSGKDGMLWMQIAYKGGYRYDLTTQKILPLPSKVAKYFNPPTGVFNIYIDKKNILWIATNQFGLMAYDIAADKIIIEEKKYFYENRKWATSFLSDTKNNLWIGTNEGLYILPVDGSGIVEVKVVNNTLKKENLSLDIQGICQDKTGAIWFTADNSRAPIAAIGKYKPGSEKAAIIYNEKEDKDVAETGVDIREIVCDNRGDLYAAFRGAGIVTFSSTKQQPTIRYLTKAQGINSTYINYLQSDARGNIWCSTALGISCYKPDKRLFVNFNYIAYGIENTSDAPIYFSPYSENLYVGQHNAIRYCNTNASALSIGRSNLLISEFSIFNKPLPKENKELLDNDVIRLKHYENMISVEFALLCYTNSSDNTYSWMLKGLDKDWTISKNNIASYTNLKPGTYTLQVKAANSQGEWVANTLELVIIISPPFYKTWWFIGFCILIIAVLIYWLMQQRINRIKARYRLRNKIATDLHDEIGSTLTSISILSNVSQQAMEQQPQQAKEMLQQISTQSKNIQQSMSDIVWSIRPDNEKIENLVVRMREYAAQTLEPLDIKITIDADESLVNKVLPMECRKDLLLIYKEAINNIAKHAGATVVVVSLSNGGKQIQLSIQDNGIWKGESTGTGTKSMNERAAANGGKLVILPTDKGTTVTATIPIT